MFTLYISGQKIKEYTKEEIEKLKTTFYVVID